MQRILVSLVVAVLCLGSAYSQEALHEALTIEAVVNAPSGAFRLERHPTENLLYVLTTDGRILSIKPDSSAVNELYTAGDHNLVEVAGLAVNAGGDIFLSGNRTVDRFFNIGTILKLNEQVEVVAETQPYPLKEGVVFNHKFNALALSPEGRWLFVNSGSRTDHGELRDFGGVFPGAREVPLSSSVFRLPADATGLVLENSAEALAPYIFAYGLRNTYDLAFNAEGELFGAENSGDRDDPDELNWLRAGHHYGFPWRTANSDNPTRFAGYDASEDKLLSPVFPAAQEASFYYDPDFPPPPAAFNDPVANLGPDANTYRDPTTGALLDASLTGKAVATFSPHRVPLGLSFDTGKMLTPPFTGTGFVVSWNPGSEANGTALDESQDLLWLELSKSNDAYTARVTRLAHGFQLPVDTALIDKSLYVLEYGGDASLWRITFE